MASAFDDDDDEHGVFYQTNGSISQVANEWNLRRFTVKGRQSQGPSCLTWARIRIYFIVKETKGRKIKNESIATVFMSLVLLASMLLWRENNVRICQFSDQQMFVSLSE